MSLSPNRLTKSRRAGRPRNQNCKVDFRETPLHKLLVRAFPDHCDTKNGEACLNVYDLADYLKCSPWGIYRWLSGERMSARSARRLVTNATGKLKIEDLTSYVL